MILKRKIYDKLVEWKRESNGTTALLIGGARRVGKSFVAKAFGENEYKSYILIDFAVAPQEIKDLFVYDTGDLELFFQKLSLYYSVTLYKRQSLIISTRCSSIRLRGSSLNTSLPTADTIISKLVRSLD